MARQEIAVVRLVSNVELAKVIDAPIEEEVIRRADDPFRDWTRTWHGRIFSLELRGPPSPDFRKTLTQLALGALLSLWSLASLVTPPKP